MPRALKVFRMPIGFEDAYVAAPSRKAALAAWGTEHDQFARGVAEEVTDPALTAEPLAHPGEVIRRSRGDLASQLKALGPKPGKKGKAVGDKAAAAPKKPAKPKPPKRDKLDAAEGAVKDAQRRHREAMAELEAQREAIERKIEALKARQDKEVAGLKAKRDAAREAYKQALDAWSD
jgi:hypothetical protein